MHIRATVSDMFQDGMNVPYTMEVWDSGCGDNNYLSGNGGGYNWATFQTDTYGTDLCQSFSVKNQPITYYQLTS